ncbi:TonB-dependent receptor [Maritalea mobilis]|uniref:TonB-dependent receptor plug domain-containing protein n=1 Tax=Maritalea mobilis TaxID=483324 RepID=UPI001C968059|nr:TonB-dependent receptor [Maritalea mobilis]MBY6201508.1 TonB-dependent receptor [Maritalea mobilis]
MKPTSIALISSIFLPTAASAQAVFELDEIVFTTEFGETTIEESGTSLSVVTREELEQTGETRIIDYIARLPGVDVRARGPLGSATSVTIRGAGQNYVRVLVDGIDVTDLSTPQVAFDFGSLTTSDISRIELLRGGQSAIYGSEAVGGVINITTRRAEEEGVTQFLDVEAGSYNTLRGSYGVAADLGAMDYALTFTHTQSDGFSAADENDGNTEEDGFESDRLSFALGYDLANGGRIGLNGFVEDARIEFDEQFPIGDGNTDEVSYNESFGLRAYLELPTGPIDSTFALTYYEIERDVRGSSGGFGANNVYSGERLGISYLGAMQISPSVDMRFGVDATQETFTQAGDYGPADGESETVGVFTEVAWSPSADFDLSATLRYDEHSRFGGLTSGRIAASWRPAEDWIIRSSAAHSFRAPSLYELFGPFGDPTLQPEESRSVDLGLERRFGADAFARITLFYNETTNLIDFPFPYAQVAGTVTRSGAEVEFGTPIWSSWRLDGSYTYTTGDNPNTLTPGNSWNLEFPEHDLSVTLTGDLTERLSAAFTAQSVWDRPTLSDYTTASATFSYAIADEVEAYLRVENLFDEEYQLVRSYGTSDRAFYIGLRSRF